MKQAVETALAKTSLLRSQLEEQSGLLTTTQQRDEYGEECWCDSDVQVVQRVHKGFTKGLQRVYKGSTKGLQRVNRGFTKGLQRVYKGFTKGLQRVYKGFIKCLQRGVLV